MSNYWSPEAFEQKIAQIHRVLEGRNATVTWNDRIFDPDSPAQTRQIDVSISDESGLTLVECRHRQRPQDVQWVEELYGRRASLNAQQVIGVSSSGFTAPALAKAERLGVFLRTLTDVSDQEVASWGKQARVTITYIEMSDIALYLVCSDRIAIQTHTRALLHALEKSDGSPWPLDDLITRSARWMVSTGLREGPVVGSFQPKDLSFGSVSVREMLIRYQWRRVQREQAMPILLHYAQSAVKGETVVAQVLESAHSQTSITRTEQNASVLVDVGVRSFVPGGVLSEVHVDLGESMKVGSVGLLAMNPSADVQTMSIQISVVRTHSRIYRELKAASHRPGHSVSVPGTFPNGTIIKN